MRTWKTLLAGAILALLAGPAVAIDFTTVLTQLDGKPFTGQDGKPETTPTTLGQVAEVALLSSYQDEQTLSGEEKVKRFALANKIHAGKDVALTAEETQLVKRLIAKSYNALITGEAWKLLDPASVPN